jgi:type III secretion protein N (ATPase)
LLASYQEIELLIRVGEYESGQDVLADEAVARRAAILEFLCQSTHEKTNFKDTLAWIENIFR